MVRGKANGRTRPEVKAGHKTITCDQDRDGEVDEIGEDPHDEVNEIDEDGIEDDLHFSGLDHRRES